jgi:hypothetical protein
MMLNLFLRCICFVPTSKCHLLGNIYNAQFIATSSECPLLIGICFLENWFHALLRNVVLTFAHNIYLSSLLPSLLKINLANHQTECFHLSKPFDRLCTMTLTHATPLTCVTHFHTCPSYGLDPLSHITRITMGSHKRDPH